MSSRFTSNLTIALLGAALATMSLVFGAGTVAWLAFGAGCAATLVGPIGFAWSGRGALQRSLDVIVALLGAWMIIDDRGYKPALSSGRLLP